VHCNDDVLAIKQLWRNLVFPKQSSYEFPPRKVFEISANFALKGGIGKVGIPYKRFHFDFFAILPYFELHIIIINAEPYYIIGAT